MKRRILLVALIIIGSFNGGLALNEYRQRAPIIIHYTITEYNEDGTIYDTSKSVRICNRRGEWTETQILSNGKLHTASGKVTPRDRSALYPDAPRQEFLGRTVLVVFVNSRSEVWYDPSTDQLLKEISYTDETRQTIRDVVEAVEIKE